METWFSILFLWYKCKFIKKIIIGYTLQKILFFSYRIDKGKFHSTGIRVAKYLQN